VHLEQGLLLILRGVNFNPGADPEDMVALRAWIEEDRIITMRQRRVTAVDEIREAVDRGEGPTSKNDFIAMVVERLTERIKSVVDEIDDQVDELDDEVFSANIHELRSKLADLRHQNISLRRYISPQRDVLIQLCQDRQLKLGDDERSRLREAAERTARFIEDIDHARDRAVIIGEELNSRISEQMSKTMYRLSIIAAIFMPLGLLTGLLGINVGGIPGSESEAAFFIVSLLLVAIAAGLYIMFKRMKWL
jgi:zinc transporter